MQRPKLCVVALSVALLFLSCEGLFNKKEESEAIARVGDNYLYKKDIAVLLNSNMSKADSASFVTNYINNWATKHLLMSKAKINIPEEQLAKFDQLVSNYKSDLYTRAYKDALVSQANDTLVSASELESFYEKEKENFRLKDKIVRIRFIELPKEFLNKDEVIQHLKNFNEKDKKYLDSIGVQFKKLNFNDSIWVSSIRVVEEIGPLNFENEGQYLKKSQFFELQDSIGVYLAKVNDVLNINDIAPLPYVEHTIKQLLLNRRKLNFIRKLETDIIDEAIKEKEFEVYEKNN